MAVVPKWNNSRFPSITLLVVLGSIIFYLIPETANWLVYDREQLVHGDLWRLFTGHLVHFSWMHLFFNISVFALLGYLLELHNRRIFLSLIALTALVSSLYFLLFMPDMIRYAGLSGLVSAAVVYLSLYEIQTKSKLRFIWELILLLFVAKVGYEILVGESAFAVGESADFIVVPSVHIIGAFTAVLIFIYKECKYQ